MIIMQHLFLEMEKSLKEGLNSFKIVVRAEDGILKEQIH